MRKLGDSEELKGLLGNAHLRDYLRYVNSMDYPRGFMKQAMQAGIFHTVTENKWLIWLITLGSIQKIGDHGGRR